MEIDIRSTLAVAIVSAVGLTATLALADDKTPPDHTLAVQAELKHEAAARHQAMAPKTPSWAATTAAESKELREAALKAKAAYATMTPEEKAIYKKGMKAQRQKYLQAQEALAQPNPPTTPEQQKAINALKSQPKPLPDAAAKQKALKETEKNAGPGS